MSEFMPGEEFLFEEGSVTFRMNLLCKCDRLWFSNGLSFPLGFKGVSQTGKLSNKIVLFAEMWKHFRDLGLTGKLDDRNPGDLIWIYSPGFGEAELDHLIVKDSDRKIFITAKGRMVSFDNDLYLWTGYSIPTNQILVSDEATSLLHQMYP